MIYKCWLLVKMQLWGFFRINAVRHTRDKREKRRLILMGSTYVLLALLLLMYAAGFSYGFVMLGLTEQLPSVVLMVSALLTLILTFMKCNGTLFGMKDYDFIMSMPVSSQTVILSRLFSVYLFNFLVNILLIVPASIVYVIFTGAGLPAILMLFLSLFLAPLVPMMAAAAIGAVIMAVAARLRRKNLFVIILSLGATIAVAALSFAFQNTDPQKLQDLGTLLDSAVSQIYPLSGWFARGVTENDWGSFALFALTSAAAAVLFVALLARFYVRINTRIATHAGRSGFRMGSLKAGTPFWALYKRELRLLGSCAIYAVNSGIGALMLVAVGIALLFVDVGQMLQALGIAPSYFEAYKLSAPFLLCLIIGINSTTTSALSLEGKSCWIMCSLPVESKTIFASKIAVNLTVMLPAALVAGILCAIALEINLFYGFVMVVILAVFTLFISVMGMYYNARYPRYDWTTEQQAVKQGIPVLLNLLTGFLTAGLFLALTVVFRRWILPVEGLAVALLLLVTLWAYRRLAGMSLLF